jgi:hypothetical protein
VDVAIPDLWDLWEQLGLLDPTKQMFPSPLFLPKDEGRSSVRNVVTLKVLRSLRLKKRNTDKVQDKESSNIRPSPKAFRIPYTHSLCTKEVEKYVGLLHKIDRARTSVLQ